MPDDRGIPPKPSPQHTRLIYTRTVRLRNGKVLHAEDYGKRAFVFWVKD
jgi:hypothetical protein